MILAGCGLTFERLEPRNLLTTAGLGAFAIQQGQRTGLSSTVSANFTINANDFKVSASGRLTLKIEGVDGSSPSGFSRLSGSSPSGFSRVSMTAPSALTQIPTKHGGLLVDVVMGAYTTKGWFGHAPASTDYQFNYRLAGDVDGSFAVTAVDLDLIRTAIAKPLSLDENEFQNADVDGDGAITNHDLELAASNFGASTSLRPLDLVINIAAATPSHNGVVRLPTSQIAVGTSAGAALTFINATTGERLERMAGPDGKSTAEVQLRMSSDNDIAVTAAEDSFGQIALRRLTVQQRPAPVVIVPGWATSMPGSILEVPAFLMRVGYPAEKLAASHLIYGKLQETLSKAGYVRDRDQFIVPYDWRLPLAPDDGVQDGLLAAVSTKSILQPKPTFALGYLGNFLARLVEKDPSIVKVDMLGYSFGGLLARAYVQSGAYGSAFTADGRSFVLPEVDRLILLATPSLGSAITYPFWNNDVASFSTSLLLVDINVVSSILAPVYNLVARERRSVATPFGMIDRAAITDPVTGRPDPRAFLQRYLASLRDMLPTYAFLYNKTGQLTTINDTQSANHILLDLNATSSPGVNPWTAKVRQVTATFGVNPRSQITDRAITTETLVHEVVSDGKSGSIWPFQSLHPVTPASGTTFYNRQSLTMGDDMVPEVSLVATYAGDPKITIRPWGNGTPTPGQAWTRTSASVRHAELLHNPDVLALILKQLTSA